MRHAINANTSAHILAFMLICATSLIAILPFPELLLFCSLAFLLATIFSKSIQVQTLSIFALIFMTTLNWAYTSVGVILWNWNEASLIVAIRPILLAASIFIIVRYYKQTSRLPLALAVLILIMALFSLLRSYNFAISSKYLINVYIPIAVLIASIAYQPKKPLPSKQNIIAIKTILACAFFFVTLNTLVVFLDATSIFDARSFFSHAGEIYRSEGGWEGNFRTMVFGKEEIRSPGIFGDPIVAGYFLTCIASALLLLEKNRFRLVFCFACIITCLVLARAKSGIALFTLSLVGFLILKSHFSRYIKAMLITALYLTATTLMIYLASRSQYQDSSYIHLLGLILPFSQPVSLQYFLGHDLGSGGNLGGGPAQGAESLIGLIMYNTGLFGVLCFIASFLAGLHSICNKARQHARQHARHLTIATLILPPYVTSFLQENSFNLSYSAPRLALYVLIILLVSHGRTGSEANLTK